MANTTEKDSFLFPEITDLKSAQKVGWYHPNRKQPINSPFFIHNSP